MLTISAIILKLWFCIYSLHCLFYGGLRKAPIYTNIHLVFITGGLLLNFLLAVIYQYINAGTPFITWDALPGFYTQGWPIMLQTFVLLYFVYYSIQFFNRKFSHDPNGTARFLYEVPIVLIAGFFISELFHWIFVTYMVVPEDDMAFLDRRLKMILMIDLVFLIVVYAFMTSFRIFRYLEKKNVELARWQREYTQSQFEAMKNQLNPHFLFNSLNALSSLVYADANLAESFIEKLSRSYRYLLEQREKSTVELKQELDFMNNYIFLLQQRFGKKLQVNMRGLSESNRHLPPHTLMILIDEIIERNTMSAARPLQITIRQEQSSLLLIHSNQPKQGGETNEHQRLDHLQKEFALLARHEIRIDRNDNNISYIIPLINPS